jgi:hypothetical protein
MINDQKEKNVRADKPLAVFARLAFTSPAKTVLTPQIAGHNLKNKLGLIKFGNHDINTKKIYT